ncbi:MAG: hypothetical protein ACFE9Q_10490 [Candidatus Hodarchaeota archaeon]
MVQNINEMAFCKSCCMNVFPTRPRFNIKMFGFFAIMMFIIFTIISILSFSIFSEVFLFIFFMWGFLIINPYLIYYIFQKKNYCPRCFDKTFEKNLDYKPFGEKESEIYKTLTPSPKLITKWHCPYCGKSLNEGTVFCGSCGKKFNI